VGFVAWVIRAGAGRYVRSFRISFSFFSSTFLSSIFLNDVALIVDNAFTEAAVHRDVS
jgi:hypothetical protein